MKFEKSDTLKPYQSLQGKIELPSRLDGSSVISTSRVPLFFGEIPLGILAIQVTWNKSLLRVSLTDTLFAILPFLGLLLCAWSIVFYLINKKIIVPIAAQNESLLRSTVIASTTQNLAHDVRKPFTMLEMVLEVISSAEDPNESKEFARAALPEVHRAIASVEGMIQDVMQIGSHSKPNQEVATCEAVIDAAVNDLFRVFPKADVGIEFDLKHRHCLFIDTMRVGRVFSNILGNAVEAMNGNGILWFKTSEKHGFVEFRLGNTGSHIPKENLPKLFDVFFTSGKKGGTGLGLAIAQKVVNEHGGSIRGESEKTAKYQAGYVEFVFTLPIANEPSPERQEPLPNHSKVIHERLRKLNRKDRSTTSTDELELEKVLNRQLAFFPENYPPILIVDDEAVYRNSLAGLLANFRGGESALAKVPLIFARNANEALNLAVKHDPFLVIQDIDLGVSSKSGIDVIRDLRKKGYKGRICVHSNRFLFEDQRIATEAGADSVLPKPMSRTHLIKLIASSLVAESKTQTGHNPKMTKPTDRPRIAYIDDTITFTLSWKMRLRDQIDVDTFSSTAKFFNRTKEEPDFLVSLDVIVTDYHFGAEDPLNGKTFAAQLREMGYDKPIFLASNGDFTQEDIKPDLNGVISKDVPDLETVLSWINPVSVIASVFDEAKL